jgi:uncharacterized protein (DUF2344 family)
VHNNCNKITSDEIINEINNTLKVDELLVEKTTKKGTTQINIIPHLFKIDITQADDNLVFTLVLSAGNDFNLKPELVIKALSNIKSFEPEIVSVERQEIF